MAHELPPFEAAYRETHGHPPFPWQTRLADIGELPRLIDIPTGCGKTSVLDVLVWRSVAKNEARRVVWVVDRRLVVDDVFEHARAVAEHHCIRAVKWRGGMTLDEAWLLEPQERAIIVSTADQVGSRLLFRGYGVPWKARPVYAGLLAFDTVIVLDEVHLSPHLARALEQVAEHASPPPGANLHEAIPPSLRVIQMSATPADSACSERAGAAPAFGLEETDRDHALLARRLGTRKRVGLRKAAATDLREVVRDAARELAQRDSVAVVGIVVNRVDDARAIFEALQEHYDAVLLTGRIRPFDRDLLLRSPAIARARPGRSRGNDEARLFVVATQTVEVGVDLDFDALVTEAAPISALRQWFGRQDRLGILGESEGVVVLRDGSDSGDPIYGEEIGSAWRWLWAQADHEGDGDPVIDLGLAVDREWPPEQGTPEGDLPEISGPEIEVLAETHPYLDADLDIAMILHGARDDYRRVSLVWRRELDAAPLSAWADLVDLAPPVRAEALALPRWIARDWLGRHETEALRWRPGERSELVDDASFERHGMVGHEDILVVPSRFRGNDAFGWNPDLEPRSSDEAEDQDVGFHESFRESEAFRGLERVEEEPEEDRGPLRFHPYPSEWGLTGGVIDHRERLERMARRESLRSHLAKARAEGTRIAHAVTTAGGGGLAADLVLALEIHDLGKADRRFQVMLHDGDEIEAARAFADGNLLAKSEADWWNFAVRNRAWIASGLPRGWRHEVESLANADLRAAEDPELVRHLVLAHHGRGRPWLPATGQVVAPIEQANRFWGLHRRIGAWALGYLEALVVIADRRASQDTEEVGEPPPLRFAEAQGTGPAHDTPVVETAFLGDTFLGFMAALGTLHLLRDHPVALSWAGRRAEFVGMEREAIGDAVRAALAESEFVETRTLLRSGDRLPWDLCSAGRVQLPNTLPVLREELLTDPDRLERTLFGPWEWKDRGDPLGWVPSMRDHALRARAPTLDSPYRENGALWLAWEGIAVYGRRPGSDTALGWHRRPGGPWTFTWPLWSEPATFDTVRSILRAVPRRPGDLGVAEWWSTTRERGGGRADVLTTPRPVPAAEIHARRRGANR